MQQSDLLLSLKPVYAKAIMAGTKTIELRRVRPKVGPGSWALIYASSPEMCLVGAIEISDVIEGSPRSLWPKVRSGAGVSKATYDEYFLGAKLAFGLLIKQAIRLEKPLSLSSIRGSVPGFRPPQSYAYLRSHDESASHLTTQLQALQSMAA